MECTIEVKAINKLDLFLIQAIYESSLKGKELTTGDLAKLYSWGDEDRITTIGHSRYYTKKTSVVNYRLNEINKFGLLQINKGKRFDTYSLDGKKVIKCQAKKIKEVLNQNSEVIMVKILNTWTIYELSS